MGEYAVVIVVAVLGWWLGFRSGRHRAASVFALAMVNAGIRKIEPGRLTFSDGTTRTERAEAGSAEGGELHG